MAAAASRLPGDELRVPPAPWTERVACGVAAALGIALLVVAAGLTPADHGIGTHTQMGFPECSWPRVAGIPCPACGMTTSFALAADARFVDAFRTQPLGALLALLTAAGVWVLGFVTLTGARLGSFFRSALAPRVMWGFVALLLAAWVYKIIIHQGDAH